jgi:hypothetical protein
MDVHAGELDIRSLCAAIEQTFRPVAEHKGLSLSGAEDTHRRQRLIWLALFGLMLRA